ncbi:ankyrin repeat domain-containing protein 65-like [Bacillus rossius redtenbacheri]|uniref:ankyrin repeat domain-containing protein 65-like n=1 Tax=Bacillus rossius redtenbacheri TaxID=93214 RepID=UPI002FDD21ED
MSCGAASPMEVLYVLLLGSCLASASKDDDTVCALLEQFDGSKDWAALRRGLEAALDQRGLARRQIRDVSGADGRPLWWVGYGGHRELAAVLARGARGANLEDASGATLLGGAARGGHDLLVAELLDRGADIEARTGRYNSTPLLLAVWGDHDSTARLLTARGADAHAAEQGGVTTLHAAAYERNLGLAAHLAGLGASVAARDWRGDSPLDVARRRQAPGLAGYLERLHNQAGA